jgi:hypothetical protein
VSDGSGGGLVALLAAMVVGAVLITALGDGPPPAEVAAAEAAHRLAELQRVEAAALAEAAADARWRPVRTAARNIALVSLFALPVLGLLALIAYGLKRRSVWMPRKEDGALPFPARTLTIDDSRAALAGRHASEYALASQPLSNLASLTYSPRYQNNQEISGAEPLALPAPQVAFRDVPLDPRTVFLGTSADGPVTRPWDQLLTLALGGETGSGKTWTGVSCGLQALFSGHRIALADPHSASPDSLSARLAPVRSLLWRPVATTDAEALALVTAVERTLRDRAEGRDRDLTPITLIQDEFTKTMRGDLAEAIARLLEAITQEGRKFAVRAVMLGQRWSATRTGGSGDLRDTIPDVLIHRMRRKDVAMLSGWPINDLPDASRLPPGDCFLLSGEQIVRVSQPRMSEADVAAFAGVLLARDGQGPDRVLTGSPPGPHQGQIGGDDDGEDLVGTWSGPGEGPGDGPGDEFRQQVLELYLAGDGEAQITDVLAGTVNRRGGAWKRTRQRVEAVIRDELARRGG